MNRKMEYIPYRNKYCDIVTIDISWYDYRDNESKLPKVGAFCKKCARETAVPMYPIFMNGRPAYALQCKKCNSEYPMYKSTYIERYIGYDTKNGGHVNPTHGQMTSVQAMDRKAREYHKSIPQRVEAHMCETFGYTPEQYKEMKKKWDEDMSKAHKRFERDQTEFSANWRDEKIKKQSETRKELIQKGILKYVKNVGLVNTETGEVVKL